VGRNADGHRILTGGDEIGYDGFAAQHNRERPRPKVGDFRKSCIRLGDFSEPREIEHVHDERIKERSALDSEDLGKGALIEGIRREAVDCLGG
jgi:hypothetical protein